VADRGWCTPDATGMVLDLSLTDQRPALSRLGKVDDLTKLN
jgi:hypothetical protein